VDIVFSEHARHKMHTGRAVADQVEAAVKRALIDRSGMHLLELVGGRKDTYAVRVNADLRAIVQITEGRALVLTIMQYAQ
jgi:hypothetical protein